MNILTGKNYAGILSSLKQKIRSAQIRASLAVNSQMLRLYWEIGKAIVEQQKRHKWGDKVIQKLSEDLQKEFPGMRGLSYRNIMYMKRFYHEYQGVTIVQGVLAQLPWWQNITLLEKLNSNEERLWYAEQAIKNGWSRAILVIQIESDLYGRQSSNKKITNFKRTLPEPQSDLAEQMMKDPYKLDFLTLYDKAKEKDIENNLVLHITKLGNYPPEFSPHRGEN